MFAESIVGVGGLECRVLYGGRGAPVLFLHGYSFTGQTWVEAGIAGPVVSGGYLAALPDMPYGRRTDCTKHTRETRVNVEIARAVVERFLGGGEPYIVGASLGGRIALYYAATYGARGLFLASPALRDDEAIWRLLGRVRAPAVIVRGGRDFVPRRIHERLAEKLGAPLIVYEGAGHAMYLDMPERFVEDLRRFLSEEEKRVG